MIHRDSFKGPITLCCDGCPTAHVATGRADLRAAIDIAKEAGWQPRHCGPAQGWCHFCPDCVEAKAWEVKWGAAKGGERKPDASAAAGKAAA